MVQVIHRAYARTPGVDVVRNDAVLAEFVATRHWKHTAPLQHRAHISNIIGTISKPSTRRWFRLSIGLMRERLALTWFATKLFSPSSCTMVRHTEDVSFEIEAVQFLARF